MRIAPQPPSSSGRGEEALAGNDCCPTESDGGALAITPRVGASLATLLAAHALRDGEVILLAIKPSPWFVLLSGLRFIAAVLIAAIATVLAEWRIAEHRWLLVEATAFLIFGRLTWAALQWMGRLYVLTDQRILRVKGVVQLDVFDCPLRKLARADLIHSTRERIFRLGTVVLSPAEADMPIAQWQMIARPRQVFARVVEAMHRSKNLHGGVSHFEAA